MSSAIMETYKRLPVAFESGDGAWLTDTQGNHYLDALAGIAVCSLGHAHPAVAAAVSDQATRLIHTSNLYEMPLQEQLAQTLCRLSGFDRVFFNNSGAEANETAIKVCRKYGHDRGVEKPVIVTMDGGFHGRTLATLTATGNGKQQEAFAPLPEGFIHVPYNDVAALEALAADTSIVAVMLEAIQGEGGVIIPAKGYLKQVAALCDRHGWLLVVDEVQTGLCRTGRWFAFQHEDIQPDIMTLAKSLGNGVPIGACLVMKETAATLTPGTHGSTFGGNPLAARAALTVIETMESQKLDQQAAQLGASMLDGLHSQLAGLGGVRDIRGKGLMLGIELEEECRELVEAALQQRLLINVTRDNVVRLLPPLIISDEDAGRIVTMLTDLIRDFVSGARS
ncbi:MAG: aspartate aminotransferase family protein [Gammaproteobacteria bacterium]